MASSTVGTTADFVGRGWAWPFGFDKRTGGVSKDQGSGVEQRLQRILWAILRVLGIHVGEVFMARKFGSGLRDLVGKPNDSGIISLVEFAVTQAIERWEKRIRLDVVVIAPDPDNGAQLNINLAYTIRRSNVTGNLVYPLYLNEEDREIALRAVKTLGI